MGSGETFAPALFSPPPFYGWLCLKLFGGWEQGRPITLTDLASFMEREETVVQEEA